MKSLTLADTGGLDAALIMFRAAPENKHCSFLFVEGDSDEKFWQSRIAEKTCCIVFVVSFEHNNQRKTGKTAVIKHISDLNKGTLTGFLGIIDYDFEGVPNEKNVCVTDTHDLETLLLKSPVVFRKLLAEFGDAHRIAEFESQVSMIVQAYLLKLAVAFARIEWLKQQLQPSLELKDLYKNNTILNPHTWFLDSTQLDTIIIKKGLDIYSLTTQTLIDTLNTFDPWLLCNGHTMIDLLSIGLQNGVLGKNTRAVSESLSIYIRGAMEKDELYQTELCRSIFHWQNNNSPYEILI